MSYAYVTGSELKEVSRLPKSAQKLVDGEPTGNWVMNLHAPTTTKEQREECGYFLVTEDEKLSTKSNQYLERNLVMRYGEPVIEWRRRIKPLEQQVAEGKAKADAEALASQLESLGDEHVALGKFIALTDPSLTDLREIVKLLASLAKRGLPDA